MKQRPNTHAAGRLIAITELWQRPMRPSTLVVFTMAFAIAHFFGIWGAAAGALKGFAGGAAATAIGLASGGSAGLADQIPGGACV